MNKTCVNRSASDWPGERNDVTKSHPIADENAVSVCGEAEVIVVEDGEVTRQQSIGTWLCASSYPSTPYLDIVVPKGSKRHFWAFSLFHWV